MGEPKGNQKYQTLADETKLQVQVKEKLQYPIILSIFPLQKESVYFMVSKCIRKY